MPTTYQAGPNFYELQESWPHIPAGHDFKQVAGVAVDVEDNVYIYNRGDHKLAVFDRDGVFMSSWEYTADTPHGICISGESSQAVFLADCDAHIVTKHSIQGTVQLTLGSENNPSDTGKINNFLVEKAGAPFNRPTGVAIASTGDIFISDGYANCRVHKFDPQGNLTASWGVPGKSAPLEFHCPHGIAIDSYGRVLVCDRENDRIQVLDQEGNFLAMWTGFLQRCSVVNADGLVVVAELQHRVSVVDLDGRIIARWGGVASKAPGLFLAPHTVAVDSHGDVYIGEVLEGQRIQKFAKK